LGDAPDGMQRNNTGLEVVDNGAHGAARSGSPWSEVWRVAEFMLRPIVVVLCVE
jgi:hypothetical protein